MWTFEREQKVFDIHGVKVGGVPGLRPSVLIGTIFYKNHEIVTDGHKGEFDRSKAEKLINIQEEFSEKTGNPCMLDVVGASSEAMIKTIDFAAEVSACPLLMDGISPGVRVNALEHVEEVGLSNRIVYNSIVPQYNPDELEALAQSDVKNVILLAYNVKSFTSRGRLTSIKELIPTLIKAGMENILIDTFVLDIPSLGLACKTIFDVKNELGYPAGCGAHNAVETWIGLKTKMGKQARDPSIAVTAALPIAFGGDFVLYGPIEEAPFIFPTVALVDAALAQMSIERGKKPDQSHPLFKIA